jgi:plasmid stabilization system protein ParE
MRYDVVIIAEAEEELEEAYRFIREDSPTRAKRWRESLLARAKSLSAFPGRCAIAPESFALGVEVRQLVVSNYRVLHDRRVDRHCQAHSSCRPPADNRINGNLWLQPSSLPS